MEKLPLEIFTMIIEQAADGNPLLDTLKARLVNHEWNRVFTETLITSRSLEVNGFQIHDRASLQYNHRFQNLPREWKIRYLKANVKNFEKEPYNFSH
ncbi:hypothetical protein BDW74DRAFT_183111 [Aspergillus multicolor]|uniref:uncharacterized protein n=1 Tax=Aspergillus multicolor TaxID=41759 RepID=UPI003CCCEF18